MDVQGFESKGFSVGDAIKHGWRTVGQNKLFVVGMILLSALAVYGPLLAGLYFLQVEGPLGSPLADMGGSLPEEGVPPLDISIYQMLGLAGLSLYGIFITLLLSIGFVKVGLALADGQKGRFRDLFNNVHLWWKFFLGNLLYMIVVFLGMLLFVIPGVVWALRYSQYPYFILEKGVGPVVAFKLSRKATFGAKWDLLAMGWVGSIVGMLGMLCLFIGMFATLPTVLIAQAFVYRQLMLKSDLSTLE